MAKKISAAFACFLGAAMLSLALGAARLTPADLFRALCSGPRDYEGYIFWYARLPRTAACLLAGAALAVSGAVVQGTLRNPLASPSIIGVNAGAGLGVTVCCTLGALSGWAVAGSAFLGALGAVSLIVLISEAAGASRTTVILGGVAVNALLNALSEAVTTLRPEAAMPAADFRVGGFGALSVSRLIPAGALILLALGLVFTLENDLEIMALGEEMAQGLGMNVKTLRKILLLAAAVLSGAAVSFGGLLGFVGLMVPHALRAWNRGTGRGFLPLCALAGGAFVALCDTAGRMIFAPYELPVGILLSAMGGPFFLWLLLTRKGGRRNA